MSANMRAGVRLAVWSVSGILWACPQASPAATIKVDADFPGGNIIVDAVEGDSVKVRPDLRDTEGNWFYWAFRVRGAQSRTLEFVFTEQQPIGVRGPAVSLDEGETWAWLGRERATNSRFTYTFPPEAASVRFSFGMPYTESNLKRFLDRVGRRPALRVETLTTTRKGRPVERLHLGSINGQARHRVLITARHHACEMMANYALEGLIEAVLAEDETGRWYRKNVEVAVLPFMDKDGVEDGDQGKNRRPRDHNRDYSGESVHRETAALRAWVPRWSGDRLVAALDLHCPHIRGPHNEVIYQPGKPDPRNWEQQRRFAECLKESIKGPIPYEPANDLPFGKGWNVVTNMKQGDSSVTWANRLPGIRLATTLEIPYANASGKEVTTVRLRAFGRDLARALRAYIECTSGG